MKFNSRIQTGQREAHFCPTTAACQRAECPVAHWVSSVPHSRSSDSCAYLAYPCGHATSESGEGKGPTSQTASPSRNLDVAASADRSNRTSFDAHIPSASTSNSSFQEASRFQHVHVPPQSSTDIVVPSDVVPLSK